MKQTVIILLVNAATTIIVTVVTVRLTMTGRIVSQTTKDRFTKRLNKYGLIVVPIICLLGSAATLSSTLRASTPITKSDVLVISAHTTTIWIVIILLIFIIIDIVRGNLKY